MPADPDLTRPPQDTLDAVTRRRRRRVAAERIWFGVLACFAILVASSATIVLASAHPRSCVACHGVQAVSMEEGLHATARCESCHAVDSVAGILQGRLAVIDMVAATAFPARVPVVTDVPPGRCLNCHADGMNQTVVVGDLRMNHRAPVEAGWSCSTCHPAAGHEVDTALGGYTMDMCLACHAASAANLMTCEVCHVGETIFDETERSPTQSPWRVTHGPQWRATHGMGDLTTCSACHLPQYCVRCHGENVPHGPDYLREHGRDVMAREEGAVQCFTCHRETGCDDCHGMEMPHPAGFLQGHSAEVDRLGDMYEDACMRCHTDESCINCHTEHTHPGLTKEHIEELRRRPVPYPGDR